MTATSITKITSTLTETGYAFIANQSKEDVSHILGHLGEVIYTTDVKINHNSRALVTSSKALDFHTDHHKAKWILWYCLEQTDVGGESILVDATLAYQKLENKNKKILAQIMLFEHKIFDDDENSYPLVKHENGALEFYYSFWMANENMPPVQKTALTAFRSAIANESVIKLKLQKNDILIIDNHRILHGRCKIEGHQNRFLKRFWIQSNKKTEEEK